ncbi:polysaccharide deacetylase family protein [Rhodopirellula sp. JC740]|uniref:Polysaccharide deacetylase family protein n=1 Tax=Rhodopirellula halodulae TaxID=2894198 RepID=A0ABS8NP56_9BACT|nr:polysaccharide deacetylase family protein [Rhodopirellula sp. JC740]MCC9645361.1 polysaccharide deacetylase family protein [Rhodopirellula sp. JC740]
MSNKPVGSLSIDLDNKWAYLRAAGNADWETASSYLPMATQRIVDLLGELNLPLTVFLVGRDLDDESDVDAIHHFDQLGQWEPANHSLNHLPWMHTMSDSEIQSEIMTTHDRIFSRFGTRPVGFRGPGFSCPTEVLRVLIRNDYSYDASIFPTSMAPVARAVFLARTNLQGEEREKAKKLYGGFDAMRNPNRPFVRQEQVDGQTHRLREIPVSTLPFLRTPIHFSYVTFLATFSVTLAKLYFASALNLCRLTGTAPSLLLHPPDFLGCEDDADMAYFPGMKMSRDAKLSFMRWALSKFANEFNVLTMREQTETLAMAQTATPQPATT